MDKPVMAELLTKLVFRPKKSDLVPEFAAQLFIEDLVVPKEVESYSEKQLQGWILEFLNKI